MENEVGIFVESKENHDYEFVQYGSSLYKKYTGGLNNSFINKSILGDLDDDKIMKWYGIDTVLVKEEDWKRQAKKQMVNEPLFAGQVFSQN